MEYFKGIKKIQYEGKKSDNPPENLLAMPTKKHSAVIPELKSRIRFLENQIVQLQNKN